MAALQLCHAFYVNEAEILLIFKETPSVNSSSIVSCFSRARMSIFGAARITPVVCLLPRHVLPPGDLFASILQASRYKYIPGDVVNVWSTDSCLIL